MCLAAFVLTAIALPLHAETIPVFTPDDQKRVTAAVVWNEVFSGDTVQTAFMAADPDPEDTPHAFGDVTPVETVGTATAATEMGPMTSTGRMRLLTPRLFAVQGQVKGMTEMAACNWSTDQLVTWVGE